MDAITIHSYKGGTGKTYISSNLAAIYSSEGKVCLLDLDLRAPSIQTLLGIKDAEYWVNDYLNGECKIDDVLIDTDVPNLYVGLANPTAEAIRDTMGKSRKWEMQALKKVLALKETLKDDGFKKLIFDTSPGFEYSSINAIVGSDVVGLVLIIYEPDLCGTEQMISGLYEILEKPVFLIINKITNSALSPGLNEKLENRFDKKVLAGIQCFCEVSGNGGTKIFSMVEPEHPFTKSMEKLSRNMESSLKA